MPSAVSQSMRTISLYLGSRRYALEPSPELLSRANQAISTLERYKSRLDEVSRQLGLKLVKEKRPMPVLVIDSMQEKPTD